MKPLIGISCSIKCLEKSANFTLLPQQFHFLGEAYTNAVERAGGIPVILPSFEDPELMKEAVGRLDGVILSGGADIDPALFGERIISGVGPIDFRRDQAEAVLTNFVLDETDLPVLGICRGMQLLNAVRGGKDIQDLKSEGYAEHRLSMYQRNIPSHDVDLVPGSRIAEIMGSTRVRTNSFHHQAVRTAAPGWIITGCAKDDQCIEAMEVPGERFLLCVQWHPEGMVNNDEEQALFRALVNAAKAHLG